MQISKLLVGRVEVAQILFYFFKRKHNLQENYTKRNQSGCCRARCFFFAIKSIFKSYNNKDRKTRILFRKIMMAAQIWRYPWCLSYVNYNVILSHYPHCPESNVNERQNKNHHSKHFRNYCRRWIFSEFIFSDKVKVDHQLNL